MHLSLRRWFFLACLPVLALAACGGSNPVDNPPEISNQVVVGAQKLSFAYYQKCVNPVFLKSLPIPGTSVTNTCASSGCHAPSGTGAAFKIVPGATAVDVTNPANTPAVIKESDMYKNFISAQAMVVLTAPEQSRLINKPLLRDGFFHGGGLIFEDDQDPDVKLIHYWITNPTPLGQDEFSTATYSMFNPADPNTGTCLTQ